MATVVKTFWNAGPLKGAVRVAFRQSVAKDKKVAQALCRWTHVRRTIFFRTAGTRGIVAAKSRDAHWLEEGIHAHGEDARVKKAMTVPPYGVFRHVNHPPVAAHPFLKPAAAAWPPIVRAELRAMLRR